MRSKLLWSVAPALIAFTVTSPAFTAPLAIPIGRPAVTLSAKRASFSFELVTSAGALECLPDAHGEVRISELGANQQMDVAVHGLPPNTTLTLFVLQLPHAPFGLSWYQGDVEINRRGDGHASFVGRFSDETFITAVGAGAAPVEHGADADTNPATAPVHTLHLGMWFDSTADAVAGGCVANQTRFNGDHTAGIQVFNTTNFPDEGGPLGQSGR